MRAWRPALRQGMILLQALVNGLVSGTLLAVPAIGFTAMFAVLRFPNFSVSGVATISAFAGYLAYGAGLQMAGSLAVAFAVAGAAGLLFDKAMRASADNPELAALKGIRPERIAMMASFVGMGLVGVGGMLLGLDSSIDPLTGTRILLSIFAAAVLGGLGSAPGAVLGAFLIGIAEELSVLAVGSQYRAAVGFVAILIVLSLRPRGLLGERAF